MSTEIWSEEKSVNYQLLMRVTTQNRILYLYGVANQGLIHTQIEK